MSARTVLRMGDPRLQRVAEPVTRFDHATLHELIDDMFATLAAERGAGLAAPQIAVPLRVVVFAYEKRPDYPECDAMPPTVLINPTIEPLEQVRDLAWEGCLSVPGMRGLVPRYRKIRYRAQDVSGAPFERVAEHFHARVVQHECDHLDGILYPQRMSDMTDFGFLEELTESGRMATGTLPCEDRVAVDGA